ncbi:hypothetical protein SAMN05444274_106287 [Mariniphaga anaerophila]|uniref:Uncharacterized protein n=1 Tax=Mariniphaga anaerophila TaxID=1484053 RepID=A0A1M5CVN8_9BACT|nr:hypothetical protein [Mariniphaga anaerophila]SHF58815.1 hypothetical protein SAMN05444274_106287 [Mariniphaga anaerophila]
MKRNYFLGLLLLSVFTIISGGCSDEENTPLSFYEKAYEIPIHGTRYIGVKSGSGDYSILSGNSGLFSASKEEGWSNPAGMILVRGLLTGESTLAVTDNQTGETISLTIKVTDNYEVLRVSDLYWNGSTMIKSEHPVLSKAPFLFLVNNNSRDVYFADDNGEKTITSNGLKIQGKGNYSFAMEDGKPYLTLIYPADENGQLTDATLAVSTPHKFQITQCSEFFLHRLDEYLNLGWETIAKDYSDDEVGLAITMEEVESGCKLEGKLEEVEIPVGVLN